MSKKARSARGTIVDFDLLAIKQQLATTPVPVGAAKRRKFIDEKDGLKTRTVLPVEPPAALMMAITAAQQSMSALDDVEEPVDEVVEDVVVAEVPAKAPKK